MYGNLSHCLGSYHEISSQYNPGPRPTQATLTVDEGMGIANASSGSTWLVHEIYPREEVGGRTTPIGAVLFGGRLG
jgi:hypothetical protein